VQPLGSRIARSSGGTIGIAGIHHDRTHVALRRAQVFFGNEYRRGDDKILREDGGGRGRNVARKNREIERAGFL
jgi:hypothetical protein